MRLTTKRELINMLIESINSDLFQLTEDEIRSEKIRLARLNEIDFIEHVSKRFGRFEIIRTGFYYKK